MDLTNSLIATPIHPASYTTLMTIPAAVVRTPKPPAPKPAAVVRTSIVAVPPIAIVSIGAIAIPIAMIAIAVVAVPAAVISTAICTPLNSAVDASNAPGC